MGSTESTKNLSMLDSRLSPELNKLSESGKAIAAGQQASGEKARDPLRKDIADGIGYLVEAFKGRASPQSSEYRPDAMAYSAFASIHNSFLNLRNSFLSDEISPCMVHPELGRQLLEASEILSGISKIFSENYQDTTETHRKELPHSRGDRVLGRLWAVAREFSYAFYEFSYAFNAAKDIPLFDPSGISLEAKREILDGLCNLGINSVKKALVYSDDSAYRAFLRIGEAEPEMDKREVLDIATDSNRLTYIYLNGGPGY